MNPVSILPVFSNNKSLRKEDAEKLSQKMDNLVVKLRAMTKQTKSDAMITAGNYHLYVMRESGEAFIIGMKSNKDKIGGGCFKTVKGGVHLYTGQKIVYMIMRGSKAIMQGEEEFRIASLFKGCVGIGQIYSRLITVSSAKRMKALKFVMIGERYNGDLVELANQDKMITKRDQRQIAADMGEALHQIEVHGIAHQDMKLENFCYVIDQDTGLIRIKLIDFGLAVNIDQELQVLMGTPYYYSPRKANLAVEAITNGKIVDGKFLSDHKTSYYLTIVFKL